VKRFEIQHRALLLLLLLSKTKISRNAAVTWLRSCCGAATLERQRQDGHRIISAQRTSAQLGSQEHTLTSAASSRHHLEQLPTSLLPLSCTFVVGNCHRRHPEHALVLLTLDIDTFFESSSRHKLFFSSSHQSLACPFKLFVLLLLLLLLLHHTAAHCVHPAILSRMRLAIINPAVFLPYQQASRGQSYYLAHTTYYWQLSPCSSTFTST
jgi:hypothetical protein